ncbi:MAG: carboxylating nicotinate-nucleotide diphosphorylase [Acidobacteriaceae bacterium]|jgi:nicotinate-nucleotide pyrophosphorylase (carboxylating)|nr:carboxylating nicotinate-nucleotide diphosphorylase [Acidobacteriaceae bacterium]
MRPLPPETYRDLVSRALAEDVGSGDVTTAATVDPDEEARGIFLAKSSCVIAGLDVAFETFRQLQADVRIHAMRHDGDAVEAGPVVAEVSGKARTLLVGERTALNFLQRMSGIATLTRAFVTVAAGRITVLDTRKTTPTLRALEKYAVTAGGGTNHRFALYDAVLIKDNHARLAGGVGAAVARARAAAPGMTVEVEAQSLAEVDEAIAAGADIVLVDNLPLDEIQIATRKARGRAKVEISGGVTLDRMPALAETGADYVSVGALTHSAKAVDLSFEITLE